MHTIDLLNLRKIEKIKESLSLNVLDINEVDINNGTALIMAIKMKDLELIKLLIKNGADVNLRPYSFCSPLYYAKISGSEDIFKILIENDADFDAQDVIFAIDNNYKEVAVMMVEKKCEVDGKIFIKAAEKGDLELVSIFIDRGIDLNISDEYGNTALYLSSQNGHTEVVKLLIKNNANVNILPKRNAHTPLMVASYNGHTDVIKILVEYGADIDFEDVISNSAISIATSRNNLDTVKLLLELRDTKNINIINREFAGERELMAI